MAERVEDWTDLLAFCTKCHAVFQSLLGAEVHERDCKVKLP